MKLIPQRHIVINRDRDMLKLIELCARVCYKSESRITDESSVNMIKTLVSMGHLSQLEHATITLKVPLYFGAHFERMKFFDITFREHEAILTGNLRAFYDYFQNAPKSFQAEVIHNILREELPEVFPGKISEVMLCSYPMDESDLTEDEQLTHIYRTVRFITNRGVSHELVRHRRASYSQESTRYCNYGGEDMKFIQPVWWEKLSDNQKFDFSYACISAESKYNLGLKSGLTPQQAREVLPNALKTEVIVTANLKEWQHIFKLRCAKAAHPQMRALMLNCIKDFQAEFPQHFVNLSIK